MKAATPARPPAIPMRAMRPMQPMRIRTRTRGNASIVAVTTGTVGTTTTQPSAASFEWHVKKWPTKGYDGWALHSIVYGKTCIKEIWHRKLKRRR